MEKQKHLKKLQMWYKIKELNREGLSNCQIAQNLGIERRTVARYLSKDEEMFTEWLNNSSSRTRILKPYYAFVKKKLMTYPSLSAAQIEDMLKENFKDLPNVCSKTIYNFVQAIRKECEIPKPKTDNTRNYHKLDELDYGYEAQVDFGETHLLDQSGKRVKVWFFAMVLSRSRQKYVYFQTSPFTTATSIVAHQLAFRYFGGVPKHILYDQDRVFVVNENLGDIVLTQDFRTYVNSESFEAVFCRKADPESKGKVENVVRYVKYNFLKGREFTSLVVLNDEAMEWLNRTGNMKPHGTTRKIPFEEWKIEKEHLLPIKAHMKPRASNVMEDRIVLKDHTISYKCNFYSVPSGTYQNRNSKVLIKEIDQKLNIYTLNEELITTHDISVLKGQYVRNTDHRRDKSKNIDQRRNECLELLGNGAKAKIFIDKIKESKPRYYNDNLRYIIKNTKGKDSKSIEESLNLCIENENYNGKALVEFMNYFSKQIEDIQMPDIKPSEQHEKTNYTPSTSNIHDYQNIFNK